MRCGKGFNGELDYEIEGDGKCPECVELGKKIALKVDLEMERRRKENPIKIDKRAELIRNLVENGGRINARDLDISNWGS